MNPYNQNLNSAVCAVLQTQALTLKTLKAQHTASMFTLYYTQGAKIAATQNLVYAKSQLATHHIPIKQLANNATNLSANVLTSADQANQYVKQAVTNGAVAAANIQVAANAIIRLASDAGSIFSIVSAADFDSEIYELAKKMRELLNETAYGAEQLAEDAMEASMKIAEVSAATVYDDAKNANLSACNLFKIVSAHFDAALQIVNAVSDSLTVVDIRENTAEGNYTDIETSVTAALAAYTSTNNTLNLNLNVVVNNVPGGYFSISFTPLHNPFKHDVANVNPIKAYFILLVKTSKAIAFNIIQTQQLHAINARCCVAVTESVSDKVLSQQISTGTAWDADDEAIIPGNQYVAFIFAIFTDRYKKELNAFDDFLSAPSAPFAYSIPLNTPENSSIWVEDNNSNIIENAADLQISQAVKFSLPANTPGLAVEYRCIFLTVKKAGNEKLKKNTFGFIFNDVLAEAIASGNYGVAVPATGATNETITYNTAITPATTDNFGNRLIINNEYVPAILAVYSGGEAEKPAWYKPTLSDFYTTASFKYLASHN
jgi:hypothetical protein